MPALLFVSVVLAVGLSLRKLTRLMQARRPKPSLIRQAIMEQLTPEALERPKLLLATAGSDQMAEPALRTLLPQIRTREKRTQDKVRVVFEGGFCEQPPLDLIRAIARSCYVVDDDLLIKIV